MCGCGGLDSKRKQRLNAGSRRRDGRCGGCGGGIHADAQLGSHPEACHVMCDIISQTLLKPLDLSQVFIMNRKHLGAAASCHGFGFISTNRICYC